MPKITIFRGVGTGLFRKTVTNETVLTSLSFSVTVTQEKDNEFSEDVEDSLELVSLTIQEVAGTEESVVDSLELSSSADENNVDGNESVSESLEVSSATSTEFIAPPDTVELRAFPGGGVISPAEGYGATAMVGADRTNVKIFKVTNTNDSGPGSFRQAMTDVTQVPENHLKIIVFHTGGYIDYMSQLNVPFDSSNNTPVRNVYIAGQTAPGDGITMRLGTTGLANMWSWDRNISDIVFRGFRMRLGGQDATGFLLYQGVRMMMDHVSITWVPRRLLAWARNDIGRSGPIQYTTFQNSIFAESMQPLVGNTHVGNFNLGINNAEPYDTMVATDTADLRYHSLWGNIFMSSDRRNPNLRSTFYTEAVNNVMYNYHHDALWCGVADILDYVNNWTRKGPWNRGNLNVPIGIRSGQIVDGKRYKPSMYVAGNVSLGSGSLDDQLTDPSADNWSNSAVSPKRSGAQGLVDWHSSGSDQADGDASGISLLSFRRNKRMWDIVAGDNPVTMHDGPPQFPVTLLGTYASKDRIVSPHGAGACIRVNAMGEWMTGVHDSVDQRYRNEINNGTGISSILRSPADVGGFPSLAKGSAPADSNGDGIPDAFYSKWGYNPAQSGLAGTIVVGGYCLAECYVNGISPVDGSIQMAV